MFGQLLKSTLRNCNHFYYKFSFSAANGLWHCLTVKPIFVIYSGNECLWLLHCTSEHLEREQVDCVKGVSDYDIDVTMKPEDDDGERETNDTRLCLGKNSISLSLDISSTKLNLWHWNVFHGQLDFPRFETVFFCCTSLHFATTKDVFDNRFIHLDSSVVGCWMLVCVSVYLLGSVNTLQNVIRCTLCECQTNVFNPLQINLIVEFLWMPARTARTVYVFTTGSATCKRRWPLEEENERARVCVCASG